MYITSFKIKRTNISFVYKQDSTLSNSSGQPVGGHTDIDTLPGGKLEVTITLNPSYLHNASQEFIVAVVFS